MKNFELLKMKGQISPNILKRKAIPGLPQWSSSWGSMLLMQGIQSLIGELGSHMPYITVLTFKKGNPNFTK